MLSKRNRAAASTTAPNNNQLHELYRSPVPKSSTKLEQIRNLLITLDGVRWFTRLLFLASEQSRAKGNLKLANYYSQLALTTLTIAEAS